MRTKAFILSFLFLIAFDNQGGGIGKNQFLWHRTGVYLFFITCMTHNAGSL